MHPIAHTLRTTRALPATSRLFHLSSAAAVQAQGGKDPRLSPGHVSQPEHNHPGDPHDQAASAGQDIARGKRHPSSSYDAAAHNEPGKKTDRSGHSGNQEGVGFAEQVGSASASGKKATLRPSQGEGKGGKEESTPPGLFASVKSKLGPGTSSGEVKQNRGGGVGVTGTGALPFEKKPEDGRRAYHASAVRKADRTRGQAPEASRQPKEKTHSEQNPHLKHKKSAGEPDTGKGNAAEDPKLPSHKMGNKKKQSGRQRRSFTTSAYLSFPHNADSYSKDVDTSPPSSKKTHQVDNSATGSDVQRPTEALSGEWSQASAQTKEYETVSKEQPYDTKPSSGPESQQKARYGNVPEFKESHSSGDSGVSEPNEGPEGASRGGRKPEGRA